MDEQKRAKKSTKKKGSLKHLKKGAPEVKSAPEEKVLLK
jgi:hypothetical protein